MNKTSKRGKCTTSNSVLIFNCEDTIFDIERLLYAQNSRLVAVLGRHRSGASTIKGGVEWIGGSAMRHSYMADFEDAKGFGKCLNFFDINEALPAHIG